MQLGLVIAAVWIAFFVSWFAAALWSDKPATRASRADELGSRLAVAIGAVLLAVPGRDGWSLRLWHVTRAEAWVCIGLIVAGLAFSWWARLHLGRLWSARVVTKAGHRVVDSGPYALVRHPIYTGILLALYATAAAKGTLLGVAGVAVMTYGFWLKARLEERWLAQELPAGDYAAYRRRVPMLLPFGPKGRQSLA